MNCPNCGEKFSYIEAIKLWLTVNMPDPIYRWREKRKEEKQLQRLKALYSKSANLTDREHFVCGNRVNSISVEAVAFEMSVTSERVRQIQAKALRKLERSFAESKC
jgi:DNA-directed RNA polymerase sigma subunit (sigma70/sigma32)